MKKKVYCMFSSGEQIRHPNKSSSCKLLQKMEQLLKINLIYTFISFSELAGQSAFMEQHVRNLSRLQQH